MKPLPDGCPDNSVRCGLNMFFFALSLMTLLSCATSGTTTASRAVAGPVEGTYDFVATVPQRVVRGSVRIERDTLYVNMVDGCSSNIRLEPMGHEGRGGVYRYACDGAVLAFDTRNPVRSSKWSATVLQKRRREVCAERAVRNGREVCVRTEIETYEVPESRSGLIQVTRRQ